MRSCNIFSCVMSSGSASSEDEYSWKCSPSLWFIMDERTLYGCQNTVLSTSHSPAVLQRGGSQSIIDHLFFLHLLHSAKDQRTKRSAHKSIIGHWNVKLYDPSSIFYLSPLLFLLFFIIFCQMKKGTVLVLGKEHLDILALSMSPRFVVYDRPPR